MRGVDRRGTSSLWPEGHEHVLPPKAQNLVEGRAHMEHVSRGPSGVLPGWLTPGDGLPSVPERAGRGCAPQYVPLPDTWVSPGGTVAGMHAVT